MGVRRGRRGNLIPAADRLASLTRTELTIVVLVAECLFNAQVGELLFVSRRTVQAHLAHVFAKLHITSRPQLAADVIRQRGDQQAAARRLPQQG
jgi:DNA-binding NarL/FixJ family response regulator